MAREINLIPSKTYKTKANMEKAIAGIPDLYNEHRADVARVRYLTCQTSEGRFYPVFIGQNIIHLAHSGFCVAS